MNKEYQTPELDSQTAEEPETTCLDKPTLLHLDVILDDNAMIDDIKKAIKMIKGIVSVRVAHPTPDNSITPTLAKKIEKARKDFEEGKYTECKTKEELESFLERL